MMHLPGRCKIDGVSLGEISVNLLHEQPILIAKYALVNAASGNRFGAGSRQHWSLETLQRLSQLIEAMEKDCASDIFDPETATIPSGIDQFLDTSEGIPSL